LMVTAPTSVGGTELGLQACWAATLPCRHADRLSEHPGQATPCFACSVVFWPTLSCCPSAGRGVSVSLHVSTAKCLCRFHKSLTPGARSYSLLRYHKH
jgi:hypothetical protein